MDLVVDAAGFAADRNRSFQVLRRGGRVMTVNPADSLDLHVTLKGAVSAGLDIAWKKLKGLKYYAFFVEDFHGKELEEIADLIDHGKVKPIIDSVFPLDDIRKAHEKSESLTAKGKIVIEVSSDAMHKHE